ncbi:acylase [Vitiosangium sp. GDMCC 1.1324]|uniref:acylase n=1 Tax=Vitiosangium sp. (strain GDMCC 1.1324) TaxID=2138576 RepID=UPI000D36C489|nr:acylase [Vitiosangium sp. GDMCC 1.1324]PTL85496.1 acylase [Vitiosangium sp. GDMCC 1.1324]
MRTGSSVRPPRWHTLLVTLALVATTGCPNSRQPEPRYQATIRRTAYGIPHITAPNIGGVGFGQGYAFARDHACSLADQIIKVRGERARFFGAGPGDAHIASDFAYHALDLLNRGRAGLESQSEDSRQFIQGFADGYNHFLESSGATQLPCAGQPWLRPIGAEEMVAYLINITLTASGYRLTDAIAAAQPPSPLGVQSVPPALPPREEASLASNGWALGAERSANRRGMVLANPHFPWEGELRLWESHLTVPGQLDVYGVSLLGVPGVLIGFNKDVAWTHTFSSGSRFTAYLLQLVPGKPTTYVYEGQERQMTARTFTIQVLQSDGSLKDVSRTLYSSHHGPLLALPGLGWTGSLAICYRDANIDNTAFVAQFLGMGRSTSLQQFQEVFAQVQGAPWVNTMATDREGNVWYMDASPTPNLSAEALTAWQQAAATPGSPQAALLAQSVVLLDGSRARDEWVDEPGARSPGLVPYARMPQLSRRDFVFNSNDSYWLANPAAPLEGFSPLHGFERVPQTPRTRMNLVNLTEVREGGASGPDGRFTLEELQATVLDNRSMTAELLLAQVVQRCQGNTTGTARGHAVDLTQACAVLAAWNGRYDLSSVGAPLWRELMGVYGAPALQNAGPLFATPFSPSQPRDTPNTLVPPPGSGTDPLLDKLAEAVLRLGDAGIAVDAPLGQVQFTPRAGSRIPLHGGVAVDGTMNVVSYRILKSTVDAATPRGTVISSQTGLTTEGYVDNYGTSFLMAMNYTDSGVEARAVLTYGESEDTASSHFNDQLPLFAQKQWRPILFSAQEIANAPDLETITVTRD